MRGRDTDKSTRPKSVEEFADSSSNRYSISCHPSLVLYAIEQQDAGVAFPLDSAADTDVSLASAAHYKKQLHNFGAIG